MSEPTPRQVLYALVAGAFLLVVAVLTAAAAAARLVPLWWTVVSFALLAGSGVWMAFNWRRTATVLLLSISLFIGWTVGTLILS